MIYAELAGGLGNQMFIYAFARALGLRCNEPVTLLDRQDCSSLISPRSALTKRWKSTPSVTAAWAATPKNKILYSA